MSYVSRTLAPDEVIQYRVRFHWVTKLGAVLALVFLGVFIIGIIMFVQTFLRVLTTEIVVTNDRLVMKQGVVARKTQEVSLDKIEEINLVQSFWGRLLGYGTVDVRGTGEGNIQIPIIDDPLALRRAIQNARASYHGDREVAPQGHAHSINIPYPRR